MNGLKRNSPSSFGTPDPVLEKTDPTLVVPSMWPRPCSSPSTVPSPVKTGDVLSPDPGVSSKLKVVSGTPDGVVSGVVSRSEEHTSELQSLMRISYAVFCLKKKNTITTT